jgi:hypothetical protein
LRSLALPPRDSSIFSGSVQASHSVSVKATPSPFAEQQVHGPAAADVRPRPAQAPQQFGLGCAEAARELGLPFRWLRRELLKGRLPSLAAGPRLLVDVEALREVLERRAAEENYRGERVC